MNAKIRILLVDDDEAFTRSLKLNLEDTGRYDVSVVNNSLLAVGAAVRIRPDVVLLDVMMPNQDGPDVAMQMQETPALSKTPVIFLTALVEKSEEGALPDNDPPRQYIGKPITVAELDKAIATILR